MMAPAAPIPEFSRPLAVATLPRAGERVLLEATEEERAALARRLGIEGVRALTAELTAVPRGRGLVSVRGRVRASLDRTCVVTLEAIEEEIDTPLVLLFRPAGEASAEVLLDADAEDEEPYAGGTIDLGEAVAQTVALALDPWPRAAGATLARGPSR